MTQRRNQAQVARTKTDAFAANFNKSAVYFSKILNFKAIKKNEMMKTFGALEKNFSYEQHFEK